MMSDQDDWEFAGPDDVKAEIRGVFAARCCLDDFGISGHGGL
jgi:hypothetical protein